MPLTPEQEVQFLSEKVGIRQVSNTFDRKGLSTSTKKVDTGDLGSSEIQDLMTTMRRRLQMIIDELGWNKEKGIGIAANQLRNTDEGKDTGYRIFLYLPPAEIHSKEYSAADAKFFINPEICKQSEETQISWVGCFSDYNHRSAVESSESITVWALDPTGKDFGQDFSGPAAALIQHEFEHLNGEITTEKAWIVLDTDEYRKLRAKGKLPSGKDEIQKFTKI